MPTVITHAAVPLCIGLGLGSKVIPPRLLFAGIILAMLPDADVLSFKFGVAYGNVFGHRGFTHSLVFAFVVPLLCVLIGRRWFRAGLIRCWLFLTVSLLSHSLLDSVTTGGKGVGWLWPWSDERFFAPWQVIKVAPFALSRYTTPYGHQVIISELMWVWLPGMVLMGMLWWRAITGCENSHPATAQLLTTPGGPLRAIFQHDPHLVKTVTRRICRRPVFRFTGIQTLLN